MMNDRINFLENEIKKNKNIKNIIIFTGLFFCPLWLLNIGRGRKIIDLEQKLKLEKSGSGLYYYEIKKFDKNEFNFYRSKINSIKTIKKINNTDYILSDVICDMKRFKITDFTLEYKNIQKPTMTDKK